MSVRGDRLSWNEFRAHFPDEEACLSYLVALRWPDGFSCPRCGHHRWWAKTRARLACVSCRHETTVTAGTLLSGSRSPLAMWFAAVWYFAATRGNITALGLEKELGLGSYKTALDWMNRLRSLAGRYRPELLRGNVTAVVFYIPLPASSKREKRESSVPIAVALETGESEFGRVSVARLAGEVELSLVGFLTRCISPGATIRRAKLGLQEPLAVDGSLRPTNRGSLRRRISKPGLGFQQIVIQLASWLQRFRPSSLTDEELDLRLAEFAFHFNGRREKSPLPGFARMMAQMVLPPR